jgi:UDP-glucose 4-epimerase
LVEQLERGETGTETYEIASKEDMGVIEVAEIVRETALEEQGIGVEVKLVENPRSAETMIEEFGVDISAANGHIGWTPNETIRVSVQELLRPNN